MWSRDVTEARADRCRRRRRGRRRRGARRGGAAGARARVVGSGRRPPRRRGADGRPDPRPGGAQASQGARAQRRRRPEGTRPHRARAGAARVGQRRVPLADRRAAAVAMSESLGVAVAFSSGLFSFLSPCVLPLFPSYLSFITGMSVADLTADLSGAVRWRILGPALALVVGFSIVFVALGASFSAAGQFLLDYRDWIRRIGGVPLVGLGPV